MAPKKRKSPQKRKTSAAGNPHGPSPAKEQPDPKAPNLNVSRLGPDFAALRDADLGSEVPDGASGGSGAALQRTSTPLPEDRPGHPLSPGSVASSTEDLSVIVEDELVEELEEEFEEAFEDIQADLSSMSIDQVNSDQQDIANMAHAVTADENVMRTSIEADLNYAENNIVAGRTVRAEKFLVDVEPAIKELNKETIARISKIRNADQKKLTFEEWRGKMDTYMDEVERIQGLIDAAKGVNPAAEITAKRDAIKAKINLKVAEIKECIVQLNANVDTETADDNALARGPYLAFKERIDNIRAMIRPTLENLSQELVDADPTKRHEVHTDYGLLVKELDASVEEVHIKLHKSKMEDNTLTFNPPAHSTTVGQLNVSGAASSFGSRSSRDYNYLKREIPVFKGEAAKYMKWKKEMCEDILPGRCAQHQIRLIAENSPNPEVEDMFEEVSLCWDWMDSFQSRHQSSC